MREAALPPNLRGKKHTDFPPFLRWIPRAWTAWAWGEPKKFAGNQKTTKPIGPPGTWQISYFPDAPWWAKPFAWYIGATTKGGVHVRLGARYDDVDSYVEWPSIAWKRLK